MNHQCGRKKVLIIVFESIYACGLLVFLADTVYSTCIYCISTTIAWKKLNSHSPIIPQTHLHQFPYSSLHSAENYKVCPKPLVPYHIPHGIVSHKMVHSIFPLYVTGTAMPVFPCSSRKLNYCFWVEMQEARRARRSRLSLSCLLSWESLRLSYILGLFGLVDN